MGHLGFLFCVFWCGPVQPTSFLDAYIRRPVARFRGGQIFRLSFEHCVHVVNHPSGDGYCLSNKVMIA